MAGSTGETGQDDGPAAVDARIASLPDWRGATLARLRDAIRRAVPGIGESIKWRKPTNPHGVPVWEQAGIVCTGEVYKDKVKLTFAQGAALPDPSGLFNAGLSGGTRRAIDVAEGASVDDDALAELVRAAVALNMGKKKPKKP